MKKFRIASIIVPLICTLICSSFAQQPLKWQVFTTDNNAFLCSPSGLQLFSSTSRSIRPVVIDPVRNAAIFSDFIEYEGYLLAASDAGLYQIDMNTLGSERIALPEDKIIPGKIAIDMDFLWLSSNHDLYSFDKLSREWQTYPLPQQTDTIIGAYSTGEEVFCAGKNNLYRFTVSTEKWNTYKIEKSIPGSAAFFAGQNTFKIIDNSNIRQYQPTSFSWETTIAAQPILDMFDEDSVLYFSVGSSIMKLTTATGVIRPLDISGTNQFSVLTKFSDTLIIATANRLIKYDTKNSGMEFIEYPADAKFTDLEKITAHGKFIIAIYKSNISFYDKENRAWQTISRSGLKQKTNKLSWNDEGLKIRYSSGYQSVLTGNIEDNISFKFKGYEYDTVYYPKMKINKKMLMGLSSTDPIMKATGLDTIKGLPLINLNFHTTDPHDRNLDLFFDNTSNTTVPVKGLEYQGNRDDRLNNVTIGTTSNEQLSSASLPSTQIQGGSVVVESKKRVENRDRKIIKFAAGSGYVTTRTEWRMLPFQPSGIYYLKDRKKLSDIAVETGDSLNETEDTDLDSLDKDTISIVPGSVRVWVDGEVLDSNQYTFYADLGKLQFISSAPVDPVSAIAVQYKVQTIPDGKISDVEFIPEHNFGLLHYGALTVSPHEIISARVGFTGIDSDDHYLSGKLSHPILNFASPVEVRKQNFLLKFSPDISYDTKTGARAGSATLQSRIGEKAGIVFNGMATDKSYISPDTLTYGYGKIENQYDVMLSYDPTQDIPISYYQHRRQAAGGIESRYSGQVGLHFPNYPFLDVTLSRNEIEKQMDNSKTENDTESTVFDSLYDTKDKIRFRLYETSSKHLENLTRIRKISYDISHSEYRTEQSEKDWIYGRMTTAEMTVTPIQSISVNGNLLYRSGARIDSMASTVLRPGIEVQTTDAPKGVDINASYYFQYNRYSMNDSSTDSITRSLNVILKPGQWFAPLRWFSPRASFLQDVNCSFNNARPEMFDLMTAYNQSQNTTTTGGFGFHIFPSDEILFRNFNEWTLLEDDDEIFSTENDIQVWLGSRNFWQAKWNYTSENEYHDGSFSYDRIITPWLRTQPRIAATYRTDTLGTRLEGGPALTVNLNFQNVKFFKSFFNSHDFKVTWTRKNGETSKYPQIGYTFNLSSVILPNIQISNFETVSFSKQNLIDFQSRTTMIFNF